MTDKYAVIGNPITHSKSPLIHRMFANQTGQDISYKAVLAPLDGFTETVEQLRKEGYKGCNVTVPFKFDAFELCDQLTDRAQTARAVNTLKFDSQRILGDNTDGIGLVNDVERNLGIPLQGKNVLLMGAGGAAYGVALPLWQAGTKLTCVNRTVEKARQLAAIFGTFNNAPLNTMEIGGSQATSQTHISYASYPDLKGQSFDIAINATSSGLSDETPPLPSRIFASGALAYDMMYGKETPFMKFAREHGAAIVSDGLGMLVEQAAEAFFIWRGMRPDTRPILEELRLVK